jgi:phosphate transport system substrate-binding protein
LEQLARMAYERDPALAALHVIVGNDQTLLEDLDAGRLDAAIVYSVPESGGQWITTVAMDGLVIFTHPETQLNSTGLQELKALFAGRVTNWSTFDLVNSPVVLFSREPGSGAGTTFDGLVMGGLPVSANSLVAISEMDMLAAVTGTPGAVGYGMMGSIEGVAAIAIEGSQASTESTANGTYPLLIPLYFVSADEPSGNLQLFLSNLQSEEGQSILGEKYGRLR